MLHKLLIRVKDHSLTGNALALTLMQFSNYLAPLIVLPYLSRVIGSSMLGFVVVTLAAIQFVYVITDYGFSLSATRDIALNSSNKSYISRKIGAIWGAKLPLLGMGIAGLVVIPVVVPTLHQYANFFSAAIPAAIGMAFQPIWLFLGIEKMRNITAYMIVTKLVYVLMILSWVRSPTDAILAIYGWSTAQLAGLGVSIWMLRRDGYSVTVPSLAECFNELKESAEFFWSRLSVAVYTSVNTVVIGTQGAILAAHYSVCDQIFNAGKTITSPVNTALYPYMTKRQDWQLFYRLLFVLAGSLATGCLIVALLASHILGLLFGAEYVQSSPVLVVLCGVVVINYFGVAFGYPAFSAIGRSGWANKSVMWGATLQMVILFILYEVDEITPLTMALSVMLTEAFVAMVRVLLFLHFRRVDAAVKCN